MSSAQERCTASDFIVSMVSGVESFICNATLRYTDSDIEVTFIWKLYEKIKILVNEIVRDNRR